MKLLEPIGVALVKVQAKDFQISGVYELIKEVFATVRAAIASAPIYRRDEEKLNKLVDDRLEFCLDDVHILACALDPRRRGAALSNEDDQKVIPLVQAFVDKHEDLSAHRQVDTYGILCSFI